MSDETNDVTPESAKSAETAVSAESADPPRPGPKPRPQAEASAEAPNQASAPSPVSAASRARRIGGRPVVPSSPTSPASTTATPTQKRRPAPPAPGTGRHLAPSAEPAVKLAKASNEKAAKEKEPKAAKAAKAPKAPKEPKVAKERGDTPSRVPWIPAGVFAVAIVVLIVLIGIASHGVYWDKNSVSSSTRNSTQQAALASAKTCVSAINTYDYRNLPKAEAAALACTTGKFTSDLKKVYETTLKTKAPVAKATQTAQVNQAGIRDVSADGKQLDILIYGQLTLTNVSTPSSSPQYDPFGAVVTMNKVGSKWLVSKVGADVGDSVGS